MRLGRTDEPNPDGPQPAESSAPATPSLDEDGLQGKYGAPKEFDWSKVRNKKQRIAEEKRRRQEEETTAQEGAAADDSALPAVKIGGRTIKREHAIAGAVVGVFLGLSVTYYYFRSTDDLAPLLSAEQAAQLKAQQQRENRETLEKLIKEVGPDHPQVLQMKMELGDVPFPSAKK